MSNLKDVTDATFTAEVLRSTKPVLVDVWATWCAPCRRIAPILEGLAAEYGDAYSFLKLDADTNMKTVSQYRIGSVPTLMVFKNGELVDQFGSLPKATIKARLDRWK